MIRKKFDKRGVFYSISVLLLLVFLVIVFSNKAKVQEKDEAFHTERAKIIIMDHFVRDFDRYYAQNIIETAVKPSLANLTRDPFNRDQLIKLMAEGTDDVSHLRINPLLATNENFQQSLATLSFKLDNASFDYVLESAEQLSYDLIRLNFSVNYYFKAFDTNWSKINKFVSVNVPVYGLRHPDYGEIIDSDWEENATGTCYINRIMTPAPQPACSGMNIMP
jgi:hypothetical protein